MMGFNAILKTKRVYMLYLLPFILAAIAIPKAAEIDVEECPVPKESYLLSDIFGKPLMPPN